MSGWIGFDLDGTIAEYHAWEGPTKIGKPIPQMVALIKDYLNKGYEVKILTARMSDPKVSVRRRIRKAIQEWCEKEIGTVLPVTCVKDYEMIALYDDRAIRVGKNTGMVCGDCSVEGCI